MTEPTVLKLGGSVITDKDSPETVDDASLKGVLDAVETAYKNHDGELQLVIVHGGGSFGHVHAAEHGVSTTSGTSEAAAAAAPAKSQGPTKASPLLSCMVAVAGALGAQYQESWGSAIPGGCALSLNYLCLTFI